MPRKCKKIISKVLFQPRLHSKLDFAAFTGLQQVLAYQQAQGAIQLNFRHKKVIDASPLFGLTTPPTNFIPINYESVVVKTSEVDIFNKTDIGWLSRAELTTPFLAKSWQDARVVSIVDLKLQHYFVYIARQELFIIHLESRQLIYHRLTKISGNLCCDQETGLIIYYSESQLHWLLLLSSQQRPVHYPLGEQKPGITVLSKNIVANQLLIIDSQGKCFYFNTELMRYIETNICFQAGVAELYVWSDEYVVTIPEAKESSLEIWSAVSGQKLKTIEHDGDILDVSLGMSTQCIHTVDSTGGITETTLH